MKSWADNTRLWMQRLGHDGERLAWMEPRGLACGFRLFEDWNETAQGVFRGPNLADWLTVELATNMTEADPKRWDEAFPFDESGFPSPTIARACVPRPRLSISTAEPVSSACLGRLEVDEARAISGLVDFGLQGGRMYLLLLRRRQVGWKVLLSLATEAGSGNELRRSRDDQRRAALVFGSLDLSLAEGN